MLTNFNSLKEQINNSLAALNKLATERNTEKILKSIKETAEKLQESRFNLVVMGEFKRGKTTFVNSLLGDEVLPSAVVPLTCIATEISYAEKLRVDVYFENGQEKEISLEEIHDYVTEKGNPKNEKKVKGVKVYYPSNYLKDGVILVDTPGVGSVYEHNTEVAYDYLPKADAGIFLITADPPISKAELAFLNDVKSNLAKLFFVQNKIDYLDEDERLESLDFSKNVIEESLGEDSLLIYPLSAKRALIGKTNNDKNLLTKSNLSEFEKALDKFLMEEKGAIVLLSAINRALNLVADESRSISLEIKSLETPLAELKEKLSIFKQEIEKINRRKLDNHYLMKGQVDELIERLDEELTSFKQKQLEVVLGKMEEFINENKQMSLKEVTGKINEKTKELLTTSFEKFRESQEKEISEEFQKIAEDFVEETNQLVQMIIDLSSNLFELNLEPIYEEQNLTKDSTFYYLFRDYPTSLDMLFTPVKSALPKAIAFKLIKKNSLKKLGVLFDRQSGRVRYDFVERTTKSLNQVKWMLDEKIDDTAEGIEKAVERAMQEKEKSEKEVANLTKLLQAQNRSLEEIKEKLHKIKESI